MIYDDDIKVHPLENVRGQNFDVHVSPAGTFKAEFKDTTYTASSPEELRKKLMVATKQAAAAIDIPFDVLQGNRVERGHCTGIHSSNHNFLIRWPSGRKSQERTLYRVLQPLTSEQRDEWLRLNQAKQSAERSLADFERQYRINLHNEVQAALDKAGREDTDGA